MVFQIVYEHYIHSESDESEFQRVEEFIDQIQPDKKVSDLTNAL